MAMERQQDAAFVAEGRKVRIQFSIAEFFYGGIWATLSFITLFLSTAGQMNSVEVGLVMSITSVCAMVATPVWGVLADKIGSRRGIFLILTVVSGIGMASMPVLAPIRVLGLSIVAFILPASTLFRQPGSSMMDAMVVGAANHFGISYSSIRLWNSLGYTIIAPIYTWGVGEFGLGFPFYGFCVLSVLTGLLAFRIKEYDTRAARIAAGTLQEQEKEKLQFKAIFKNPYLVIFFIVAIFICLPGNTYWFLTYLIEDVGGDPATIGTLSGFRTALEVLGLLGIPLLRKKLKMTQPQIICLAMIVYVVEYFSYSFCHTPGVLSVVQCLNGLGAGINLGAAANYVYELAPNGVKTTATTVYGACLGGAGILGNAYAGWAIEAIGSRGMFVSCGFFMIFALVIFVGSFLVLGRKHPAPIPLFQRARKQENENR